MHANETFALEWEGASPNDYWSSTKQYVQNFLQDVASNSGQLNNPYSDTTQYWDNNPVTSGVPSSARAALQLGVRRRLRRQRNRQLQVRLDHGIRAR